MNENPDSPDEIPEGFFEFDEYPADRGRYELMGNQDAFLLLREAIDRLLSGDLNEVPVGNADMNIASLERLLPLTEHQLAKRQREESTLKTGCVLAALAILIFAVFGVIRAIEFLSSSL